MAPPSLKFNVLSLTAYTGDRSLIVFSILVLVLDRCLQAKYMCLTILSHELPDLSFGVPIRVRRPSRHIGSGYMINGIILNWLKRERKLDSM